MRRPRSRRASASGAGGSQHELPALVPAPRHATAQPGAFAFAQSVSIPIVLDADADDRDFASARALRERIRSVAELSIPIEGHRRAEKLGPRIQLGHGGDEGLPGDAYQIEVSNEVVLARGGGPAGLRYAVETLSQLIGADRGVAFIPGCTIDDAPAFALRGIMLDVSRGKVPTAATLHALVDRCVELKLNVLMLYTEHTFRFRRHPAIGAENSPLDAESLRALDSYAAERFVELVPSLQSLGHMEHILKLPDYAHMSETDLGWTVSPQAPDTYALLRDLYDEYIPNFRSKLFNANCDEPWDLERGKSAERAAELGPGGVYLEHVSKLQALAKEHGKRTLIWGDVVHAHPNRISEIDRDLVLLDWWYEADFDYERVRRFAENELEFMVCPGTSSWNCLFPRIENADANIARWADAGRRHGALGLLNTDWGDFGHYNLQGNSWLGYAWGAQQSWSGDTDQRDFDRAFSRLFFDDASGEIAKIYRALGAIHDPGFQVFNGSALQYLYFDDVETSFFVSAAERSAVHRCEQALTGVRERIERARKRFKRESLTCDELLYACDASLLAVQKARAGLAYNAWREQPRMLPPVERRRLAGELEAIAERQIELGGTLRELWLARSEESDLKTTERRIQYSLRGLREAARNLENNTPSPAPKSEGLTGSGVIRAVRASIAPHPSDSKNASRREPARS